MFLNRLYPASNMCVFVLVESVCTSFLHPGIIYGPMSSHCMEVASRWNYNGECMIKIFRGGRGGGTFETPLPPTNNFRLYPHPCFKMFLERSLNDPPPPHFKHPSLLPPSPSTTPSPPIKF